MSKRPTAGDAAILREAKARFERCVEWESHARSNAEHDTKFAAGDALNNWQWDSSVRNARGDRPSLTHNMVRQHNLQIINDARQNKAQIKVTPTGGRATYEAAQVFSGIIRRIEYQSKAIDAYSTAIFHQVESGIGYVRVVTDYADEDSFDQEIFIKRVADPKTVYIDPDAKDYDKADMNFAFVFVDIPRDRWEEEHGKGDMPPPAALDHSDGWNDKDHVREAEYWRRNTDNDKLHLLMDGRQMRESDLGDDDMGELQRQQIVQSRDISVPLIEWFRLVGDRVEERKVWPGKYIPIVPFIGEETVIDGTMDRKGHTRAQIDAQRIYNYWASAAVEQVALQSKAPWTLPGRAVEGYETYWNTANTKNHSFLPYNDIDDSGQPIAPPRREQPPVMAQAYIEGLQIARNDLMSVTGQYQAELGMPSNERSGVAIQQRQRQGDNATYHFIDNQAKGIRQVGRILLDLIPKVYDVNRVMKVMAEDGSENDVAMVVNSPDAHRFDQVQPDGSVAQLTPEQAQSATEDPSQPNPQVIFNPNVGRYDVEADVGPSFGTQRQEAANAFAQIMAQNPAAFQVVGDFWAQNSDFPGADQLADRLKRGLPPQYKPGPDPQVAQLQQALQQTHQNAQQILQQADAKVATLQGEVARLNEQLKDKGSEIAIKDYDAETRRLAAVGNIDPMSLQVIVRQMVQDMLQTELHPVLQQHAAIESGLQQQMAPPPPANGQAGPVQ
jgi:hypothetical protein